MKASTNPAGATRSAGALQNRPPVHCRARADNRRRPPRCRRSARRPRHTTVEHTAEVQPEAPSSEIDNIETGVTDEQLTAAKDYVARTTKRSGQVNIATSSPTNVDELIAIVRAAQAMLASADTRSTKSTASTE